MSQDFQNGEVRPSSSWSAICQSRVVAVRQQAGFTSHETMSDQYPLQPMREVGRVTLVQTRTLPKDLTERASTP